MAEPLTNPRNIKTTLLTNPKQLADRNIRISFDPYVDALTLMLIPSDEEWVVHYVNKHVGFIYLAESLEIIGIYIEGMEHGFVQSHPALGQVWQQWNAAMNSERGHRTAQNSLYLRLVDELIQSVRASVSQDAPELAAMLA